MKKVLCILLCAIMLASALVISVNADKKPFGTIVEVPYSKTAPSMKEALPDASWGKSLIHIDGQSVNAGITRYIGGHDAVDLVKKDLQFDLYAMWTDTALYLCYVSPDPDLCGDANEWRGDGIQMVVYPGIIDISYCNSVSTGWTTEQEYMEYDWTATLFADDVSTITSDKAIDRAIVYGDERSKQLVVKFEMPFTEIGFGKKEVVGDGTCVSFSLIRIDGNPKDPIGSAGWLEWGNFYDAKKGWNPNDTVRYMPTVENTRTTSANTFKLVGNAAGTGTPVSDPKKPDEKPSGWAETEVNAAIKAGLVPVDLQKNYTKGVTRADLAKMLSLLIDKTYGKAPSKNDAKFTDTTDPSVLKAANLGIINGYKQNDGSVAFKPANTLKRSEMAAIINRVAKLCGKTTTGYDKEVKFTDTVNHWCKAELGYPVHMGIVKGTSDSAFSPENTLTVEQTIMMIYRTYTALK